LVRVRRGRRASPKRTERIRRTRQGEYVGRGADTDASDSAFVGAGRTAYGIWGECGCGVGLGRGSVWCGNGDGDAEGGEEGEEEGELHDRERASTLVLACF